MILRHRLLVYLIVLHVLFLGLAFALYKLHPLIFVVLELTLLFSLGVGIYLVDKALQPFDYARQFHDLLQDHQYAARIRSSPNKELNGLIALFNKMLDALYQERLKLGEQRDFLTRLLDATPSAVIVFDFNGHISLMNPTAQTLLGLSNPEGKFLGDYLQNNALNSSLDSSFDSSLSPVPVFLTDENSAARQRSLSLLHQLDALVCGENKLLTDSDGRRYRCQRSQFFDRGFARHFLLIDELTEELESSEKSTYEKLVRVLAHEVNNTVAATGSVLESVLFYAAQLNENDRIDFCTAISAVQKRNSNLGDFIERFTRVVKMPDPEPCATPLKDMVEGILDLYKEQCRRRGIVLKWTRCDELPVVSLDRGLMEQALINIIKNAIEATEKTMFETGTTGYIHFELSRELGKDDSNISNNYNENENVRENDSDTIKLSIIDSGNRLSEVPSGQLFTPFFTTKKGGQGIGLLFVREVLNRHNFHYRLAQSRHLETRFEIWIS